jgi:serine/threonine-protein kinase
MTVGSEIGPGDLVDGKYRIIRTIGEGGWGIVFEGENIRTYKRVAIKILRPHSGLTKDSLVRFEREAQAAGRIGSEHIVEVYDLGSLADGTHYMVMELLQGQELAARLRAEGPLDQITAAKVAVQLLDGLKAAHDAGILHRDLKPENLFLVPTRSGDEFVKILDFGISKFNRDQPQASSTMTGAVLGSPCYMAPEQARGLKHVDVRTDLYAVGTLMFESLTGRVPFDGENFNDLMFKIVLAPRPDPRELRPDLDPGLALLVVKSMAVDPAHRFQTAEEMSAAFASWLAAQGVTYERAPELKRGGTPRTSREPSRTPDMPPGPTPMPKPTERDPRPNTPWVAGMPVEGSETPLVSSATDVRTNKPPTTSPKGPVAIAVVAAAAMTVTLVAAGGLWIARNRHPAPAAAEIMSSRPATESASAVDPPSPPPIAPVVTLEPPAPSPATSASAAPTAASVAPTHRAGSATPSRSGAASATPKPAVTAASQAASASDAPPAATAAATPPPADTAARPVGSIEGRRIRTGL